MNLKILSAEKIVYDGHVTQAVFPGVLGQFTVLKGHAPIVSALTKGNIVYDKAGSEVSFAVTAGVVEVNNDRIVVCVR